MSDEEKLSAELELSVRSAEAIEPTPQRRRGMAAALERYYRGIAALRGVRRSGGGEAPVEAIDPIVPNRRIE